MVGVLEVMENLSFQDLPAPSSRGALDGSVTKGVLLHHPLGLKDGTPLKVLVAGDFLFQVSRFFGGNVFK